MPLSLDPLRPYADLLRWGAGLLLVALLVFAGYRWSSGKLEAERAAHAATKALHAAVVDGLAAATADAQKRADAASDALERNRTENDQRYNEAVTRAQRAETDLARALRRGAVQLRPEWACVAPGPGAGGAEAIAGGSDVAAELRHAGAAALVAGGDRADAWIGWLQRELTDTRRAVVAAGCAVESP